MLRLNRLSILANLRIRRDPTNCTWETGRKNSDDFQSICPESFSKTTRQTGAEKSDDLQSICPVEFKNYEKAFQFFGWNLTRVLNTLQWIQRFPLLHKFCFHASDANAKISPPQQREIIKSHVTSSSYFTEKPILPLNSSFREVRSGKIPWHTTSSQRSSHTLKFCSVMLGAHR